MTARPHCVSRPASVRGGWGWLAVVTLVWAATAQTVDTVISSGLNEPYGIAVDTMTPEGLYYLTDSANQRVVRYRPATGDFSDVTGVLSPMAAPEGIVVARGGLVVADAGANEVLQIDRSGAVSVLLGADTNVVLNAPSGLAADAAGNLYISDSGNNRILKLDATNRVTTYATGFNRPTGLSLGPGGRLFVADTGNHVIDAVDADGTVHLVAGHFGSNFSTDDLDLPRGVLWLGGETGLLISDTGHDVIRRAFLPDPTLTNAWSLAVYAGAIAVPGYTDQVPPDFARFFEPVGLAVDLTGAILVADLKNNVLRRIQRPTVLRPVVSPAGGSFSNAVTVTVSSGTTNANFVYTTDGTDPTPTSPAIPPAGLVLDGGPTPLKVRGFSPDFGASDVVSNTFKFFVNPLVLNLPGGTFSNAVALAVTDATPNVTIRYTTNGAPPDLGSPVWTDGLWAQTGSLILQGFRTNYTPSAPLPVTFNLVVADPVVTPAGGTNVNRVTIVLATPTAGASLRYTLDGSAPTLASPLYTGPFVATTNVTVTAVGFRPGFLPSAAVAQAFAIQVDTPVMAPNTGFFPDGATITFSVGRVDARIFYTLDGTDPTTNSVPYQGPFTLTALQAPNADLQSVRARAFAPNTVPSAVVSGQPVATSTIGVPRDLVGGVGATIIAPLVVNLKPGDVLRSLLVKVQVAPNGGAPNLAAPLAALPISTNDFIPAVGRTSDNSQPTTFIATPFTASGGGVTTNLLVISALGTNANLTVRSFAAVTLLAIPLPPNAHVGDTYTLQTVYASGTSDGAQQNLPLALLAPRTIVISNLSYTVGDSAPGNWYNAGDFGDSDLNSADVNNAFYASLGVRVPFPFTDAFDAMDAFPEDTAQAVGGDGEIRFLDWQRILLRAVRQDGANWKRAWSTNGVRVALPTTLTGSPALPASLVDTRVTAEPWPDVQLSGAAVGNVKPGQTVSVPVTVRVAHGAGLVGLEFRARILPQAEAPGLETPARFLPAGGVPSPLLVAGLPTNELGAAWSPLVNPLPQPLAGQAQVGAITFTVPLSAQPGQTYVVDFLHPDGAPDLETQYDFAASAGSVTVAGPAGGAGTVAGPQGVRLRWYGDVNQRYQVETSSDLAHWTLQTNNLTGRGRWLDFIDAQVTNQARFYRVKTQP